MAPKRKPTQVEMAARAGISRRTIQGYRAAGVDTHDIRAIKRHMRDLRHGGVVGEHADRSGSLHAARTALTKAQADKAELRARQLRRELVPVEDVRADVLAIKRTVADALDIFAESLPDRLAGLEPAEMEAVIRNATQTMLERLSDVVTYGA